MKTRFFIIVIITLVAFFSACAKDGIAQEKVMTSEELARLIKEKPADFYLVDVRTPEEYGAGHLPTALNIPVTVIAEQTPTDNQEALIVVYCRSGSRSASAKKILDQKGYKRVADFGSFQNWQGELIKGNAP